MSHFATNFAHAFDAGLRELDGEAITYTRKATGEAVAIQALVKGVIDEASGQLVRSKRLIEISPTDIAQPVAGDTGIAQGRTFRVEEVARSEGGIWKLSVAVGAEVNQA